MEKSTKRLGLKGVTSLKKATEVAPVSVLAPRVELKKNTVEDTIIEKKVNNIHNPSSKLVRLSLDVSDDLYNKIKRKQLDLGMKTTREYLLNLLKKDL